MYLESPGGCFSLSLSRTSGTGPRLLQQGCDGQQKNGRQTSMSELDEGIGQGSNIERTHKGRIGTKARWRADDRECSKTETSCLGRKQILRGQVIESGAE